MSTEIKITVSSPELSEAINALAKAITGIQMPTTVSGKALESAIKCATKEAVDGKKAEEMSQVDMAKPSTTNVEQPALSLTSDTEEITLEMLRTMGAKLKAKGIATKQVINGMGYEKLSSVPKERFAELHKKFTSLLESADD